MYHIAMAILKNHHQAEDAVSDAFGRLIGSLDKLDKPESVTVRLAFIADDDYLDTLYINFGEMVYDSLALSAENSGEIVKVTE